MDIPHLSQESSFRPQVRKAIGNISSQDEVTATLNPKGGYSGAIEITIGNAGEDHFNANIELSDWTRFPARIRAIATEPRDQGFVGRYLISHNDGEVAIVRKNDLAQSSTPKVKVLTLKESIRRICELQPLYSPENSETMQERGRLIRRDLADAIKSRVLIQ